MVFVDYQNVYMGARSAFRPDASHHVDGQIRPLPLGLRLRGDGRVLQGVRVYRGFPSEHHDPKGYSACQRQVARWNQTESVTAITRSLNYRRPQTPREKGIDVSIAVDMVAMAVRGELDVAVLFSGDTDLLPAAEFIAAHLGPASIELAAWQPSSAEPARPLRLKGRDTTTHLLNEQLYEAVHDDTDYLRRTRRR